MEITGQSVHAIIIFVDKYSFNGAANIFQLKVSFKLVNLKAHNSKYI